MSCQCAYPTDEFHGWGCTFIAGECRFLFPDSKACAEIFNEGPDVVLNLIRPKDVSEESKNCL